MDEMAVTQRLKERIAGREGELVLPLVEELWRRRTEDPAESLRFAAAEALGPVLLERSIPPMRAVRMVLAAGRALMESAADEGGLDREALARLRSLLDEGLIQVASALDAARRARRQQWLSFLSHELKNPLNTLLNALWLLREKGEDRKQAAHFIELAERAVRRLEGRIKDLRQLDEQLAAPPPGWEAQRAMVRHQGA